MDRKLAIDGGAPVRTRMLPYGRQTITDEDVDAVVKVLRSDWLTTGPAVEAFELDFAKKVGSKFAVAVSTGTAALHCALSAVGVGPGDEVIVPALTFAATANAAAYLGAKPVFADVDPETLLITAQLAKKVLTARTKALIGVDFGGQPCDWSVLREFARANRVALIADACHSLGGAWQGKSVGTLADLSAFSFHPVKHIATGEGGMVTTDKEEWATRLRTFRNHGIASDFRQREKASSFLYDQTILGNNYRLSDLQCALGSSQLKRLDGSVKRRREIASAYDSFFAGGEIARPLRIQAGAGHAFHLYVVRLNVERIGKDRDEVFRALRAEGIGVNVHYRPVYLHSYYAKTWAAGHAPQAEQAFGRILSLPMFPAMTDMDVKDVCNAFTKVCAPRGP